MRKLFILFVVSLGLCTVSLYSFPSIDTAYAQQKPIPPYAKWSVLALKKTEERYPNAKIIDYLHIGRVTGPSTSTERFKLWLKDNQKEFGVFVNVEFNTQTEEVTKITFRETSR